MRNAPMRSFALLIVDDDPEIRRYMQRALQRGFGAASHVTEAADGEDALRELSTGRYDAVITDVLLPRLDGLSLCRALEEDPRTRTIPVLIVSGELGAEERARQAVRGRPSRAFLPKPFNGGDLCAAVERLLASSGGPEATGRG
jgi:CheY-like chemotaxis protein